MRQRDHFPITSGGCSPLHSPEPTRRFQPSFVPYPDKLRGDWPLWHLFAQARARKG